ncbi:hypothetical protein GOP47_0006843 [Adiantum capillus-veneris]|uniref:Pentatricopeptide repeat-containing protein n=1 Tax=Adiantum capillus-veneris TaxID=13818 RepID=A0A9D4V4D7_ADICA|nr:hypothetical protein GOP47_0006843 [Adiantum capillus-veneris]
MVGLLSPPPSSSAILVSSADQVLSYDSFVSLLNHYRKSKALAEGRLVHSLAYEHRYDRSTFLSNCFIEMYGNCGDVADAKAVFARIRNPDMYSWHILLRAYGQNGHVDDAYTTFLQMPLLNNVSWNTMISTFAQNGHGRRALDVFHQMQLTDTHPNRITLVSVLDACAEVADLEVGLEAHALLDVSRNEMDAILGSALITMYGRCGAVADAEDVFNEIIDRDVVSWTAMIVAFSQNGYGKEALEHLDEMQHKGFRPDIAAFICAVDACAGLQLLKDGRAVHVSVIDVGYEKCPGVGNSLINMYGKCKSLVDARDTFNNASYKDVISWTAIIGACAENADGKEGLKLYDQMKVEGIIPNKVTLLCALDACTVATDIVSGREIHATIHDFGYQGDPMVGNAIINMYGKCGSLYDAKRVFNNLHRRDVVCYTSMIATLSQSGCIKEALDLLKLMEKEGIKPNDVTFVCTLNACSHTGQINAARQFFYSMNQEHGLAYRVDHYVCMIDLLGRAGHLDEAEKLIAHISSEQASVAWLCLLGACKLHGDTERAARAASFCHELDPNDVTSHVTLTNILSSLQKRDDPRKHSTSEMNLDHSCSQDFLLMEGDSTISSTTAAGSG